ncbi:hypothetical protein Tco_0909745 [Tanacetum coccineum]|uniref:Uncharacterized protein n=1 Tax=Tanacetum coccineum TaxID=301880 RepID=A0ABQ5CS50_9ASTR
MVSIIFDLLVCPTVQNPHANSQNNFNSRRKQLQSKEEKFQPRSNSIDIRLIQTVSSSTSSHKGPAPQTIGVSKTEFERYVKPMIACVEKHAKPRSKPAIPMANLNDMLFNNLFTAITSIYFWFWNSSCTEDVQPPVVQIQTRNPNPEPNVAPVVTPVPKASIPFPSRRNDERRKEKANDQIEKFYEIFRDLSFEGD